MARAGRGLPFRIGGAGPAPDPGAVPVFETLTSGTSGPPRRIRRTQGSWIASFHHNAAAFGISAGTSVAVLGALVQSLALYGAIEALHLGARLHLLADPRPDRQRAALADAGAQVLYATPTQLRLLAEAGGPVLRAARVVAVGGAKLDPATRALTRGMCPGATVREFYGAAETSFVTLADADTPEDAVGAPYPGVAIAVRDAGGAPALPGVLGEIWVRSPYLFEGYGDGRPGPATWQDGWLSVGEYGALGADGLLRLAGRRGRMVTVADQNVFPEEVEQVLMGLPGVVRAGVVAQPDARRGHVLIAAIQGNAAAQDVLRAGRAALGPLKAPRRVVRLGDWPCLPSGKTDFAALARILG